MYAQLCRRLSNEAPNFEPDNKPCTFKTLLLNKCRAEFENRSSVVGDGCDGGDTTPEEEERRQLAKRKMLGNIKFIGELAKLEILKDGVLHICIQQLLRGRGSDKDISENLECLCQILRTCGRILDSDKGQGLMTQYFDRMRLLADSSELPPRIRFMLKDVIELREDGWVPRKAATVEGPVPINQIRPAEDDRNSGYRRGGGLDDRGGGRGNDPGDRGSSMQNELFRHRMKIRSGLDDMLAGIGIGHSGPGSLQSSHHSSGGDKYFGGNPNGYGYRDRDRDRERDRDRDRDGPYRNQRGYYNRGNAGGGYGGGKQGGGGQSGKELAPRFKKNLMAAREQNLGDVELRPAANSMLFNQASVKALGVAKKQSPEQHPVHQQQPQQPVQQQQPTVQSQPPITTGKNAVEKQPAKTKKDKGPSREEILKRVGGLADVFLRDESDLETALEGLRQPRVPDRHAAEVAGAVLAAAHGDPERQRAAELLAAAREEGLLSAAGVAEAIRAFVARLDDVEPDERETAGAAVLLAAGVRHKLCSLAEVGAHTDNGAHYPLFLLVLQQLHRALNDERELQELFAASKLNLMAQLPEEERSQERLAELLEDRGLTFLYPLLRLQAELARQLAADPQPAQFYKWIKDNLDPAVLTDKGFISALVTVLVRHVLQETDSATADAADKAAAERERELLSRYNLLLRQFLHERVDLQVTAVYSLQAHLHALGLPKGLLLRWFMALYDLDIIEKEAFVQWKEDLSDEYPGKRQALFQVNAWFVWLQEESEDDELSD